MKKKFNLDLNILRQYPYSHLPENARKPIEEYYSISDIYSKPDSQSEEDVRSKLRQLNSKQRIIRSFCGKEINELAYSAAALGEIYDNAANQDSPDKKAKTVIKDFLHSNQFSEDQEIDYRSKVYLQGLLSDRTRIENLKKEIVSEARSSKENKNTHSHINVDIIKEATQNINIESFLIKAGETLELFDREGADTTKLLDDIYFTELVIAPITELIGFDNLALALNSRVKELELKHDGRIDLLERADAVLERINESGNEYDSLDKNTEKLVQSVLGEIFDGQDNFKAMSSVEIHPKHDSIYGTIAVNESTDDIKNGEDGTIGRFRLKSRGSLAEKMHRYDNDSSIPRGTIPMDLVGITLITKDKSEMIATLNRLVNGVYNSTKIIPNATVSKISPVHIAGTPDFIDYSTVSLSTPIGVIDAKPSVDKDGLELGKTTFIYKNIPIEVQVLTAEKRQAMRIGSLAHIFYKGLRLKDEPISKESMDSWLEALRNIHKRRSRIASFDLVNSYTDSVTGDRIVGPMEKEAAASLDNLFNLNYQTNKAKAKTMGVLAANNVTS